jgi:signal transduction histidine kinase
MDQEQRQRRFQNIDVQVSRISSMLDDVLTLGKLENPHMVVNHEDFEFEGWVQKFLDEFRIAHQSFDISLKTSGPIFIAADRILLRQILSNLLSNAIKYSGSSNLVELIVDRDDQQLRLVVKDYGIGIPGADLPELFKEFQRASNVGTIQGTGLGLVIVQRAVNLHNGRITIDSELGKGTSITIHLPVILTSV